MTDPDNDRLRDWVARLLQMASEARATGRHAVADQFTERAAELIDRIVSQELAGSSDKDEITLRCGAVDFESEPFCTAPHGNKAY
jgi:hypothetical protein